MSTKHAKAMFSETRKQTCVECRRLKIKCDGKLPCGRCNRLGKDCLAAGPCQRGKWQTKQAIRRRLVEPFTSTLGSKRKNEKRPDGVAMASFRAVKKLRVHKEPSPFGTVFFLRSWLSRAFMMGSWEKLSAATSLAEETGVSMKELFAPTVHSPSINKAISTLMEKVVMGELFPARGATVDKRKANNDMNLQWTDIPDTVLEACQLSRYHEPREKCVFVVQKIGPSLSLYTSQRFKREVISTDNLWPDPEDTCGEERFVERICPTQEMLPMTKHYAEQFSLYKTVDGPPVMSELFTKLVRKNGIAQDVVAKTCLYIDGGIMATMLYEFFPRKKLQRKAEMVEATAERKERMEESKEVANASVGNLDDIDLSWFQNEADSEVDLSESISMFRD